jgi:hypothetical protein
MNWKKYEVYGQITIKEILSKWPLKKLGPPGLKASWKRVKELASSIKLSGSWQASLQQQVCHEKSRILISGKKIHAVGNF